MRACTRAPLHRRLPQSRAAAAAVLHNRCKLVDAAAYTSRKLRTYTYLYQNLHTHTSSYILTLLPELPLILN